jgi:hypothetical protein
MDRNTKLTTVYNEVVRKVGFECISGRTSYKWKDLQKFLCAHLTHNGFYTVATDEKKKERKMKKKMLLKKIN